MMPTRHCTGRVNVTTGRARKVWVHVRALVTVLLVVLLASVVFTAGQGNDQKDRFKFEVASIRHNTTAEKSYSSQWQPRRFVATNIPLETLVLMAFDIPPNLARHLLVGGLSDPRKNCTKNCSSRDEILTARFDIQATLAEEIPRSQYAPTLRQLLQERFNLKAHLEIREIPVYALTMLHEGRLGAQLRRSEQDCDAWYRARKNSAPGAASPPPPSDAEGRPLCGVGQMSRIAESILVRRGAGDFSALVNEIRGDLNLPIVDRTGLEGKFEWELTSELPAIREFAPSVVPKAPTLDIRCSSPRSCST